MKFKVLPSLAVLGLASVVNSDFGGMFYNTAAISEQDSQTADKKNWSVLQLAQQLKEVSLLLYFSSWVR